MLATVLLIMLSIGCSTSQGNINIYIAGPIDIHICDDDTPLAHEPIQLCKGTPCGVNAECQERDSKIACSCPQGYEGDPFSNCTMIGTTASPPSDLDWRTVGLDRFIRLNDIATWHDGRIMCQAKGLDLLQPKNITAVAQKLKDTFGEYGALFSWLGGHGNGHHVTWLSGVSVSRDEPWMYQSDYELVATKWCLTLGSRSGAMWAGQHLDMYDCNEWKLPVLCA